MEQGRKRLRSSEDKTYVRACERKNKYKTEDKARAWGSFKSARGPCRVGVCGSIPAPAVGNGT